MNPLDALLGGEKTSYVKLAVNGEALTGFSGGSIQLSMSAGANDFDLEYVPDDDDTRSIFEGDEVELSIDPGDGLQSILTGYVDAVEDDDDPAGLRLSASGRSRTGDLLTCSPGFAPLAFGTAPRAWKNADIEKIVGDICAPFSIDVFVSPLEVGAAFPSFSLQTGETAFDAISRAALKRGLFPYCVGGDLVLARAGSTQTRTVLERGGRVIRSSRTSSWADRFSDYIYRAQARSTDNNFGAKASQLTSTVLDTTVNRFRPLAVQAEAHDKVDLKTRAEIERNTRAGNGESIVCLVDGWGTDEGNAWRPNTLVRFKNKVLGVDATLLITTVRFRFGPNEAREVELLLQRPEAFSVANYPALTRGNSWT